MPHFSQWLKRCFCLILFFSATFTLFSQSSYVKGTVNSSEEGVPMEGIAVFVEGISEKPVITDSLGNYFIEVKSGQEIILVFSNPNFKQLKKKFLALNSETIVFNPVLEFKNVYNEIIINSNGRNKEIIHIQSKDINYLPGGNMDLNRILLAQGLGVQSSNELSSSYSVRGGNFDENLVYVNDIEVYRPFLVRSGQQEGLSFANPDMVANIDFSAGGFEAKYGDKMSSVLDITYRKPRSFGGSISGSLLGGSLNLEGVSENKLFSWQIGSRYKTNQYLLKSIDTKGDYRPSFYDVQSLMIFDFSEHFALEVLGQVSGNKYLVIPQTRETAFGTVNEALQFKVFFDGQEVSKFNTYFGAVSTSYKSRHDSLKLKFITSAFRTFENETFTVQGQYYIDELENDFGDANFGNVAFNRGIGTFINHGRNYFDAWVLNAEHKGKVVYKNRSELLWGVRFQHELINDQLSEWNYVDSAGYSIPQSDPLVVELRDVVKTRTELQSSRIMGYAQYGANKVLKDTSRISFTLGVRSNYWTLNQDNVISPRATLSYKPYWKSDWLFRASAGFYYQPPFYRELRAFDGSINTNLKAQQSIHYVLSADLNFKMWNRPFKFITAAYFKQMDNLVPYEIDNVRLRYYANNNSKGFATGLDLRLNGEFVKGIESWASMSVMTIREDIKNDSYYTYYTASGEQWIQGYSNDPKADSVINFPGYIPRPTDQRVTFNLFFQDYLPKFPIFKMHLNLIFGTGLPFGPPSYEKYKDTLRMPSYRRVDIGFSYQIIKEGKRPKEKSPFKFVKNAWISLEVLNLLAVNNTVSYVWVKDVTNRQYAIPNYLTNRQLNLKLYFKF